MKCLAIDYDATYTAHPQLVHDLAVTALSYGIEVVTVTSRRKTLENEREMRAAGVSWPIIFAYDKPKKMAAIEAGCNPCCWLDDQPHMIGQGNESLECVGVFENELRHALTVLREFSRYQMIGPLFPLIERLETVLGGQP